MGLPCVSCFGTARSLSCCVVCWLHGKADSHSFVTHSPFGCTLLYSSPRPKPEIAADCGASHVSFDELLARSDCVTLHCPLNDSTRHLIDHAALAKMKRDSILINTSRGDTVDQDALVEALQTGMIGAAGIPAVVYLCCTGCDTMLVGCVVHGRPFCRLGCHHARAYSAGPPPRRAAKLHHYSTHW